MSLFFLDITLFLRYKMHHQKKTSFLAQKKVRGMFAAVERAMKAIQAQEKKELDSPIGQYQKVRDLFEGIFRKAYWKNYSSDVLHHVPQWETIEIDIDITVGETTQPYIVSMQYKGADQPDLNTAVEKSDIRIRGFGSKKDRDDGFDPVESKVLETVDIFSMCSEESQKTHLAEIKDPENLGLIIAALKGTTWKTVRIHV